MWLICLYIYRMKVICFFKVQFTSDMLTYRITQNKIF